MRFVIFVLLVLVNTSCNLVKTGKSLALSKEDTIRFESKYLNTDSNNIAHFESENYVNNALNKYSVKYVNDEFLGFLKRSVKPVPNKYSTAVFDTLYTFSDNGNIIQFYRTKSKDFISIFDVTNSKIILPGNIMPGTGKDIFLRKFSIKESNNIIEIANSEGSMKLIFYFKNNSLIRINSVLYLD